MIRMFNPWNEKITGSPRCTIGRHRLKRPSDIFFVLDEKSFLCQEHAMEIVRAVDSFYASKTTRSQILAAHQDRWNEDADEKRKDKLRKLAGTNDPGFVYYIRMDDLIKIGYAKDVAKRMRAYPPSAELLAIHPGTPALEKQMHQQFHAFLRRGREWFAPHQQVMDHVNGVREQFGDPAPFAYSYRKSATA